MNYEGGLRIFMYINVWCDESRKIITNDLLSTTKKEKKKFNTREKITYKNKEYTNVYVYIFTNTDVHYSH